MSEQSQDTAPISVFEEIFPGDTNPYGTAFGGKILALMDRAAGLAASRFSRCHCVTASLDALEFKAPVKAGEVAEVQARLVYASRHTCGVKVRVFSMDKTQWRRRLCCQGSLFMVAVGPKGQLLPLPEFEPRTEAEKNEWQEAQEIHQRMLKRHQPK